MSLWNLIRDWFVDYIWGGTNSNGDEILYNVFGNITRYVNGEWDDSFVGSFSDYQIMIGETPEFSSSITFGDWLSTTSTIIVLVLLLIAFGYLIVNLFKMFSNIFSLKR